MGGRSRAAAQLLSGKGFNRVYNLKGGIRAWQGLTAFGPEEMGMIPLRGDETSEEIIVLAYGMEDGLWGFYKTLSEKMDDSEVAGLLNKLAKIEKNHKKRLFDLYKTLEPTVTDIERFEDDIVTDVMEGGFTTEEFLEKNTESMKTASDVLSMAMMLETQAMDLYMRYSEKSRDEKSRTIFYDIAEEEKTHLKSLGRFMEEKT
jgi:rubrerythrin